MHYLLHNVAIELAIKSAIIVCGVNGMCSWAGILPSTVPAINNADQLLNRDLFTSHNIHVRKVLWIECFAKKRICFLVFKAN